MFPVKFLQSLFEFNVLPFEFCSESLCVSQWGHFSADNARGASERNKILLCSPEMLSTEPTTSTGLQNNGRNYGVFFQHVLVCVCVCVGGGAWTTSYCKRVFSKQSRGVAKDRTVLSIYAANICSSWFSAIALIPGQFAASANTGVGMVPMCPPPAPSSQSSRVRAALRSGGRRRGQSLNHARVDKTTVRWPSVFLQTSERSFHDSHLGLLLSESDLNKRNQRKSPQTIRANQEKKRTFFPQMSPGKRAATVMIWSPKLRLLTFTIGSSRNARMSLCSRLKSTSFWAEIWRIFILSINVHFIADACVKLTHFCLLFTGCIFLQALMINWTFWCCFGRFALTGRELVAQTTAAFSCVYWERGNNSASHLGCLSGEIPQGPLLKTRVDTWLWPQHWTF